MDQRTTGLILRTRLLTETSLIVHWLTADFGRIATVAKGARRPKSSFRGKLDLFYLAELSFVRSRRSDLHALREVGLRETHAALRRDLGWLDQAAYAAALIEQATEPETPLPQLYALLTGFVRQLTQQPPHALGALAFETRLLNELGLAPAASENRLTPGARQLLDALTRLDWPALARVRPSVPQLRELEQFLHRILAQHLDRIPASRRAAVAVGEPEAKQPPT